MRGDPLCLTGIISGADCGLRSHCSKAHTFDDKHPWAESVAVRGNKIAYQVPRK